MDHPFHAGEIAIHTRLGMAERMRAIGQRVVRDHMPEQHQRFYEQLPMMMVGSLDAAGRPWASLLVGPPGFMQSPHPRRLDIAAQAIPGDPAAEGLRVGAPLGFLGIELHTRRRNRMSGHVVQAGLQGLQIEVDQTIGNCPQYIQGREYHWVRDATDLQPRATQPVTAWDDATRTFLQRTDTAFLATHAPGGGADVSHRGGRPGYVKLQGERDLWLPDFSGNNMFMSFGNLQLEPRAGLLFIDFERGDLLSLSGRAEVVWDAAAIEGFAGAQRALRFTLDEGVWLREALPLRWRYRDDSPATTLTGTWAEAAQVRAARAPDSPWRPYRVARIEDESRSIRSFHLTPADGQPLPPFEAGQHLPLRLPTPGGTLHRSYTVSSAPGDALLRLSIKREGVASQRLHELRVGEVIEARVPTGRFTLDAAERRPAVLIGAGVGITPMIAFLRHAVAEGRRRGRVRRVHLIQIAHDPASRAFGAEIATLVAEAGGAVRAHLVLSEGAESVSGAVPGRFSAEQLTQWLPFDDHEFFLCGPGGFMQSVYDGLRALGVRDARIRAEAFGPSALQRTPDGEGAAAPALAPVAEEATVRFERSGQEVRWHAADGSLLALAEREGVDAPFACRAGHCGSCVTRLTAGQVTYPSPPEWQPAADEVVLCCARPAAGSAEPVVLAL